jgi:peptide/nickel transport system substrate-binding protein
VFDALYGIDAHWRAQPQMVQGHSVENDGLIWTLKLRDGLRFHDGTPVLGRDVVASIRRFAQRISLVDALMAATSDLSAPDDRTVRFRLKRPFPHLPEALAGPGGNMPAIMPERLAMSSPFTPIGNIIGSGPYRFLANEHVSGARAAYERFADYQPRGDGPIGFTSGPKRAYFDRVEWLTLDPVSAMLALRKGEVDWWESALRDDVEQLDHDPGVAAVSHYATAMGMLRFNHLYPPFDNAEIRRALLGAVDQAEAMTAVAGTNRANWTDGVGLFPSGTPFANTAGINVLAAPRDYRAVHQALARAGYHGEKIVVIAPVDVPGIQTLSVIGTDQLRRAGMNVDLQEMDASTALRRRASQQPPDKGGWNAFFYLLDSSTPTTNPFGNPAIRADGRAGWDGWPSSSRIEALRAEWLGASTLDQEKQICVALQTQLWQDVPYIPMGEYWQATAYRRDLAGVLPGCFAVFWGIRRV